MFKSSHCLVLSLLASLALSSCGPALQPAPTPSPPTAAPEVQNYTNQDFGFSLSYPAGFEVHSDIPHTIIFLAPAGTPGHRERAILNVELTFESTADWYATQAREANANLGTEITSSVETIGGQQAYILGHLPGQDINRQVFIVVNGILYQLMFMPDDPAAPAEYAQMESLYSAITSSLRFLPERKAVPPVLDMSNMAHQLELALNARSADEMSQLIGDQFALGVLSPATSEGLAFSQFARTDVIPMILNDHLSQAPALSVQYQVDWASVPGSMDNYSGYFPGEVVTPILATGWGLNGADRAVLILARKPDGSLFWRGAFTLH